MSTDSRKRPSAERGAQAQAGAPEASAVPAQLRRSRIAEAAYYLSQRRAARGAAADDLQDWLEAERAIDQQIAAPQSHHHHG